MKKNLLYLFTVLCSLSFFSSCSDDDKNNAADFSGTYAGENLKMTYAGVEMAKTLTVDKTSVTLKSIVPGEADLVIPCTFVDNAFSGNSKTAAREVTIEGTIVDKKMSAKVSTKIIHALAGNTYATTPQSLSLAYETPMKTITFMGDKAYDPKYLPGLVNAMGGAMLAGMLQDVTFNEDGTIVASYIKDKKVVTSPKGYAFYNIMDNKIIVSVNVAMIRKPKSKASANPLEAIMAMLENGLPIGLAMNGNTASFIVTRDMMLPFMDVLPIIGGMVDVQLVKMLANEIPVIVKGSTKFDLSLNLTKK
ncbi:MAG: DUF4925 domain-containing protein [Tannerellaceae bacterium]